MTNLAALVHLVNSRLSSDVWPHVGGYRAWVCAATVVFALATAPEEPARRRRKSIQPFTPPRPPGRLQRSQRSGQACVQSGTSKRRAAMSEPVASHIFHLRRRNNASIDGRTTENGLARLTSRDTYENSNARVVRMPIGSGFIAAIAPAAKQIFLARLRPISR